MILLVGCAGTNPNETIPTQVALPTGEPTLAPTHTSAPTDIPPPTPTELFIPDRVAETPSEQAYVRVVNTTSLIGVVDVYIESLAIATNLDVGSFTEREGIVAGRYELRILTTGSFLTEPAIYSETLNIFGEQSIIFVISGTIDNIVVTTLLESNDPLPNNTSRLMMVNAIEGADTSTMLVNGEPQTAITPYLQISEATTYNAQRVTVSFQNIGSLILEQVLDLRERQNYTFVIYGDINLPESIGLIILGSQAPGLTEIAVINASQSIGLIDIYFSGELFVGGAAYAESTALEPILSGAYDIGVYPVDANPDEVDPITGTQLIANPDEQIVLIVMGEPSSLRFVIQRLDPQPTYDNQARIAFINSLQNASSVLLQSTNETFNEEISYGRSSGLQDIDVESIYSFTWVEQLEDAQDVAQETFDNFNPTAGTNYVYIFAGRGFDDPILYGFDVGTLGFEAVPVEEIEPTPFITSSPTRLRLVNIWQDREFDVWLDGTTIAESIDYETATNSLIIDAGLHTVSFVDANLEEDPIIGEVSFEFEVGESYTVVIFNYREDTGVPGDVLVMDDTDAFITSASSGLRLIVLEADAQSLFGLGHSAPSSQLTQPNAQDGFRRSLPIGITQIIREVPAEGISDVQRLPTGQYNIRIIDNEEVAVTFTHIEYALEPETLYNVFLWENSTTRETTTIIVPYSTP